VSKCGCCESCDDPDPRWTICRVGDAVTTWACDGHLAGVCAGLQRDPEATELVVRDSRKAREWAGITRSLEAIAKGP
jgi:hypothetical protein